MRYFITFLIFSLILANSVRGQLVETKKLEGTETTINVSNLVNAIYLLRVTDDGKLLKTFKIIKN